MDYFGSHFQKSPSAGGYQSRPDCLQQMGVEPPTPCLDSITRCAILCSH